jgi:ABC-2 type transport system permease protein
MSEPAGTPPPSPGRTLRRLFLMLFLRGRSSRGLRRETVPKSVGSKLTLMLVIYVFVGAAIGLQFIGKPVFALSLYMHSMTLVFLGMFVAASAGEVLFNKDEADILMHRPVTPQAMLWAKIGVLVQVSLWLAGAFNLAGFFVGAAAAHPGWLYPVVHAFSTACQALFCTGCVVMIYQLCLRWFGRERLDGLMTTAQVFVGVAAVMLGQIPQFIGRSGLKLEVADVWWIGALPSAWFAGMDDALAGTGSRSSWVLAGIGLAATAAVLGLAFGKLARDYETGLQTLNETSAAPRGHGGRRRWIDILVKTPPLSWWLRDSVSRASFLLTAAYLVRDRDVKLRMYPGIAPMLVMPFIFLLQDTHPRYHNAAAVAGAFDGFGVAFSGAYVGLIPYLALKLIRYSQQWQAGDLFRVAPMSGPSRLCDGARRAILCFLTFPLLIVFVVLVYFLGRGSSHLPLLIPGIIALPIYAMIPCVQGKAVPLSLPTESAKAAGRGLSMMGVMLISGALAAATTVAWSRGWFKGFLIIETVVAIGVYVGLRVWSAGARWTSME